MTVDLTPDPVPDPAPIKPVPDPKPVTPPAAPPSLPILVGVFLLATAINNLPAIWHAITAPARTVADAAAEVHRNTASIRQIGLALASYDASGRFTAGRVDELEASADRHTATLKDHETKIADVCEVVTRNTADIASLAAKVDHPPTPPLPSPSPSPLPSPQAAAKGYAATLGPSWLKGLAAMRTALVAGVPMADALKAGETAFGAARQAAFTKAITPLWASIIPAGTEPTAAQRAAFASMLSDMIQGATP